jgi:hypothetical protein
MDVGSDPSSPQFRSGCCDVDLLHGNLRCRLTDGAGEPDLPPLKWSSLKYVLSLEDEINGEEEAYG